MDIDYTADEAAFSNLIKGRILAEVFGDKHLVHNIYEAAFETGADKSYVLLQHAVFELNHKGSDLKHALKLILEAESCLPEGGRKKAILHTKAMTYFKLSRAARTLIETEKYRTEAKNTFEDLVRSQRDSRALNGLAGIALDELKEKIKQIQLSIV